MFVGIVVPNPSSWLTPHRLGRYEFCVVTVAEWRSVLTAYEYFGVTLSGETDDEK